MSNMRKRLAKAIWKSGSSDPETIADYLIKRGWSDQKIRVVPAVVRANSLAPLIQSPLTQLPDMRSMKPDYEKTKYVQ